MNVSHPGCPGSRAVERVCFSFVVSKASIPSWCLNTTNAVVCDVNENRLCFTRYSGDMCAVRWNILPPDNFYDR